MSNGKGDKRRPRAVSREEFDRNWDAVFGKGKADPEADEATSRDWSAIVCDGIRTYRNRAEFEKARKNWWTPTR